MSKWVFIFLALAAVRLPAQSNVPVRLAIVTESDETRTAANVLTAQLSGNGKVQLLERDQIEKVYRELGLSAVNREDLKLGRILGADGLLVLNVVQTSQATNLMARLIAVKPGVVLTDESFPWPMKDVIGWSHLLATHLDSLLPKLAVLAKDAIPISVVNLRSAVSSAQAADMERQLRILTIQRLSREPQLFVLERQRMGLLSEEKELKSDESAFWNGSYLLDGTVDQNGYSRKTITINARLTPPKGAAPLRFEISGSRTNLVEVVNRLAAKVMELLNVHPTITEWSAQKEADQYYQEAKWALKWGIYPEARAAADSAWALGRHDRDCARVRISAYEKPPNIVTLAYGESPDGGIDSSLIDSAKESDRDFVIRDIKKTGATYAGAVFAFQKHGITSIAVAKPPDPQALNRITRSLNMYREFSESLSPDDLRPNSAWYGLGVDVLRTAAETLQLYYLVPSLQAGAAEKLADLRALARWIDNWISHSSSARESIFRCELNWGCFWQEDPEDCVALYRRLLTNNAFNTVRDFDAEFGSVRGLGLVRPRLIAWRQQDRKRIPDVWNGFVQGLIDSTNAFLREEGKKFVAIDNPTRLNEQQVIAQYQEYWKDIQAAKVDVKPPEKQYTGEKWDLTSAINDFVVTDSTPAQAQELKPLLANYKSNLIRLMQSKSGDARRNLKMAIAGVTDVQAMVEKKILPEVAIKNSPPAPSTGPVENGQKAAQNILRVRKYLPIPFGNFPRDEKLFEDARKWGFRIVGGRWCEGKLVLDVRYHCEMHVDGGGGEVTKAGAAIFNPSSERWDTILYPPIAYGNGYPEWPDNGVSLRILNGNLYMVENKEPLLEGNLVGLKGRILKCNVKTRQWEALSIPALGIVTRSQDRSQLFVVNNHLYVANSASIFEIIDDDQATHILASTRRRPALSPLDSLDSLGSPILFSGLSNSLCACIGSNTYCWDGTDWRKLFTLNISQPPEVIKDAVIFRSIPPFSSDDPANLWIWRKNQPAPELVLSDKPKLHPDMIHTRPPGFLNSMEKPGRQMTPTHPFWKSPAGDYLTKSAVTSYKSNLHFFVDHCLVTNVAGHWMAVEKDGYHAKLVCLSHDCTEPIVVRLKFDTDRGQPPLKSLGEKIEPWLAMGSPALDTMMHFSRDMLYLSQLNSPGVWVIPASEIESAIQSQKKILLARMPLKPGDRTQTNPPPTR